MFEAFLVQSSTTEIANRDSTYCFTASLLHVHSLMREKCAGGLLLRGKRCGGGLPLLANPTTMMCYNMQNNYYISGFPKWQNENIHSWISITTTGDLAFSQQHGIYGFKFPERFLEISSWDPFIYEVFEPLNSCGWAYHSTFIPLPPQTYPQIWESWLKS